ncbi:hypothetical protein AVEN_87946-1 [Araneus ventricosus]|uniref:Uncharacterized protein n=1 Tax=Araneus ventricosus TaxID=182803 RepID=A0A4Y2TTI5_ARAVE|nr:hypothetical protein AVEN_87946-1 [Araneus ventricosus]
MWCGITASFILGPFFFEEIGPSGPVTCTVNGTRYESLLRNQLIPALQQRGCVVSTIFMQDGAPPQILFRGFLACISEMIELPAEILGDQDHLILILVISGCGVN